MKREIAKTDLAALARANSAGELVLRVNGQTLTQSTRDELLAKCVAGAYVECELDLLAFEQRPGVQNRNHVRFRDGAMLALGRSGVGTPFLRDHDQNDSLARGGTVIASATEKRGDGDYVLRQTVKLTAPWAVELALRNLLSTVSIGWNPTGPVLCSVCNANFYRCSHYPGERYSMREMDDGTQRPVQDASGPLVCERVYTSAELVETSAVPVPAVPSAQIDGIRAALAAQGHELHGENMNTNPKLLALLGLTATAGEDEVLKAVESMKTKGAADEAALAIVKGELGIVKAEVETYRVAKKKTDEDKFIADAIASGRLATGDDKQWRALHALDATRASALMAERAQGSVTPVSVRRQSDAPPAEVPHSNVDSAILAAGGDPATIRAQLKRDGLSDASIEKQLTAMVSRKAG